MLPNLAGLRLQTAPSATGVQLHTDDVEDTAGRAERREYVNAMWDSMEKSAGKLTSSMPPKQEETDDSIKFKAYQSSGGYQKLSNLFGPAEWVYQAITKFKKGSAPYRMFMATANEWSKTTNHGMTENHALQSNWGRHAAARFGANPESYEEHDPWFGHTKEFAHGLAAKQMTGFLGQAFKHEDGGWEPQKDTWAVDRIKLILEQCADEQPIADEESKTLLSLLESANADTRKGLLDEWGKTNVRELPKEPRDEANMYIEAMNDALKIKFTADPSNAYTALLMLTGDEALHEMRGRTADVWSTGGENETWAHDLLGRLMVERRRELWAYTPNKKGEWTLSGKTTDTYMNSKLHEATADLWSSDKTPKKHRTSIDMWARLY